MSYLERLKQLETHQRPTDSTDKSTSVGFVSSLPARIERAATETEPAELGRLVTLIYSDDTKTNRAEALAPALSDTEDEPLPDPAAEARRQRVLAMLADQPGIRYAVVTDAKADPNAVIVALAIRGVVSCELRIPRLKWDPFLFLDAIERYGGKSH